MATPTTLPATFVAGNVLTAAQMNDLRGAFRVLQVVSTTKTDTFTATTSTTPTDITGLSVTITPSSTSSLVLVLSQIASSSGAFTGGFRIVRDSTLVGAGATAGSRILVHTGYNQNQSPTNQGFGSHNLMFLDSPATTSATTYKIQGVGEASAGLWVNRGQTDTDNNTHRRGASTITVMEISA